MSNSTPTLFWLVKLLKGHITTFPFFCPPKFLLTNSPTKIDYIFQTCAHSIFYYYPWISIICNHKSKIKQNRLLILFCFPYVDQTRRTTTMWILKSINYTPHLLTFLLQANQSCHIYSSTTCIYKLALYKIQLTPLISYVQKNIYTYPFQTQKLFSLFLLLLWCDKKRRRGEQEGASDHLYKLSSPYLGHY